MEHNASILYYELCTRIHARGNALNNVYIECDVFRLSTKTISNNYIILLYSVIINIERTRRFMLTGNCQGNCNSQRKMGSRGRSEMETC